MTQKTTKEPTDYAALLEKALDKYLDDPCEDHHFVLQRTMTRAANNDPKIFGRFVDTLVARPEYDPGPDFHLDDPIWQRNAALRCVEGDAGIILQRIRRYGFAEERDWVW